MKSWPVSVTKVMPSCVAHYVASPNLAIQLSPLLNRHVFSSLLPSSFVLRNAGKTTRYLLCTTSSLYGSCTFVLFYSHRRSQVELRHHPHCHRECCICLHCSTISVGSGHKSPCLLFSSGSGCEYNIVSPCYLHNSRSACLLVISAHASMHTRSHVRIHLFISTQTLSHPSFSRLLRCKYIFKGPHR